ncbi:MAG: MFS transporter [Chloroflexota bacterium]|nr:MFS transporter [Chloroflexota bacterium]
MANVSASTATTRPATHGRLFLLVTLTLGHIVMHWFQQSFLILLPEIKTAYSLSSVQAGSLQSVRSIFGGLVNFPAGFITDMFRTRWAIILAVSMAWIGLAYLLVGLAPSFALVLPAVALVGMGGAVWHPPALSALSQRWADRRGTAFSIHGVGGSTGDTLAPVAVGALLLVFTWKQLTFFGVFPAIALAMLVWYTLRNIQGQEGKSITLKDYFSGVAGLFRNKVLMLLVLSGGIRAMGQSALLTFLPIYFREDLGFSTARGGLYFSLVTVMGIVSQPALGYLGDRFGRKMVLVPGLVLLGLFNMALVIAGAGPGLVLTLLCISIFVYALGAVVLAAAMDLSGKAVGATTVGLLFGGNFVFSFISPLIAGQLRDSFGTNAVFLYAGSAVIASAFIILVLPLRRGDGRSASVAH